MGSTASLSEPQTNSSAHPPADQGFRSNRWSRVWSRIALATYLGWLVILAWIAYKVAGGE